MSKKKIRMELINEVISSVSSLVTITLSSDSDDETPATATATDNSCSPKKILKLKSIK